MRFFQILGLLLFSLFVNGQNQVRKVPRGIYFRQAFSSSAQRVHANINHSGRTTEMGTGLGFFLIMPMDFDSAKVRVGKWNWRPRFWVPKQLRIELGMTQRFGTFYFSGQPFHIGTAPIELSLVVPWYFTVSDLLHASFGPGFHGSYYPRAWVTTDGSTPVPDVKFQDFSLGCSLEFGLLIGRLDNPVLVINNRIYYQLTRGYEFQEFAVTFGLPFHKKKRR
jgi:hypothetical protein